MLKLLRFALLFAIAALLVEAVVAIASGETGGLEKAVFLGVGLLLLFAAFRVRGLGSPKPN